MFAVAVTVVNWVGHSDDDDTVSRSLHVASSVNPDRWSPTGLGGRVPSVTTPGGSSGRTGAGLNGTDAGAGAVATSSGGCAPAGVARSGSGPAPSPPARQPAPDILITTTRIIEQ